jgi:hypothetical protein
MKIINIIALLFSVAIYSQNIRTDLPVNSPQSPTTSSIGKYGEVQVNESTGLISPTIPLFDYNGGKLSIPITLNYSGNGVRVSQDPTWVGINWNINPGGVITRMVNDEPDEKPGANKLYLSELEIDLLPGVRQLSTNSCFLNPNTEWYREIDAMDVNVGCDTEVDMFNYNFMGYSGSFILDKEMKANLIKYDKEIKIEFFYQPENNSQIFITTPSGDKYKFGGLTASESSRTWANVGAGSTVNIPFTQNSFYLYEIEFLTGGKINFSYDIYGIGCRNKIGIQESASYSFHNSCNKKTTVLYSDIEKLVKLRKISNTFNNQTVEFDTSFRGECNNLIKLNTIYLKSGYEELKRINLDYFISNSEIGLPLANKYFLTNVKFYGKANTFLNEYKLTYFSPSSFPSKNSFAQDELGFYNGENSNTTLLPKLSSGIFNIACAFEMSKREAVLEYAKIGSLSKIEYPTGGYTEFEYELPYKGQETTFVDYFLKAYYRDPESQYSSSASEPNTDRNPPLGTSYYNTLSSTTGSTTSEYERTIIENTDITLRLSIHAIGAFTQHNNVKIKIIKMTPTGQQIIWTSGNNGYGLNISTNGTNEERRYNTIETISLELGTYIFKLSINLYAIDPSSSSVIAIVQLGLPNGIRNLYYPGLRIKNVNVMANNNQVQKTRYYYNNLSHLYEESFLFQPNYIYLTKTSFPNNEQGVLEECQNLATNSVKNVYNESGSQYSYEYVTVSYGGDSFENGGKQMTFIKHSDYQPRVYDVEPCYSDGEFENNIATTYVSSGTNDSFQNTVLEDEEYYDKSLKKLKKIHYKYQPELNKVVSNIKLYKICPSCNGGQSYFNGDYVYLLYNTNSHKYRLMATETEEYFGLNDTIKTTVNQSYANDKVSLPKSIESISSSGEIKKTNLFYPSDVTLIPNLIGPDITNMTQLQASNNVSQIVKVETLTNANLIETKQVFFGNFSGKILPKTIKTSKANDLLEDRLEFNEYDIHGNPTLMRKKDGSFIRNVFNNNQQLILKIENYPAGSAFNSTSITTSSCFYQNQYPNSFVTQYEYDPITFNLVKITDPKCDYFTYFYDAFGRLQSVKDEGGNVLSENQYNYKQ